MLDFDLVLQSLQLPSPITEIFSEKLEQKKLRLLVKREDLIHSEISGNKWRKLYLNLEEASKRGRKKILTFGGAYSNHIYATAAACALFGLESIGIIRGEMIDDENPTLKFAQSKGMKILRVSKEKYKHYKDEIASEFPEAYHVPEGGNNLQGRNGMSELVNELLNDFHEEKLRLVVSIGTGCTLGGLINFSPSHFSILGINVLRNQGIEQDLKTWIEDASCEYSINHDFHFGGYAKANKELVDFMNEFFHEHQIQLDPIYTSKMMYGIFKLVDEDFFEKGETIVAIHTGGLQGVVPFNKRYAKKFGQIK